MASYFHLTLDTTAPAEVGLTINDGARYTSSTVVNLKISVADQETAGYQMKIWGVAGAEEEAAAGWENLAASKGVNLPSGDGLKTVYLKVRDDVGNESLAVSGSITLITAVPVVTVTGPDRSTLSKVSGFSQAIVTFTADVPFEEYKVCVVPSASSGQDAGIAIPTAGGSINTSGTAGNYPAATGIQVTITGTDLEQVSPGDGVKIVKVFVRSAAGTWSVV